MASRQHQLEWKAAEHEGECGGAPVEGNAWCKNDAHFRVRERWRGNFVPAPAYFALNHCCRLINDAFGSFGCYLVGSALDRRDFRDVDIRFIMEDEVYKKFFHDEGGATNPLWSMLCMTISLWLSQQTGLQVDFQFQAQTHANKAFNGMRSAMGIFLDYPGDRPTEVKA